ncbi:uncharacterized protein I303_107381 [Kwoniella dejecticola CBS 10117]|uniref:Uncharacterized protein n=1 Tax=Kwoniella dejecticola CBS 10117 TaxID=1296121 RepID=A0A1A5ZZJ2_9TREE|nr:uncharacterized protein I303_06785 [Kwoniella dejecticola CBS 10117]OBR83224.1 hypothetical protein I303_06785 [Kwoniella dejecticola CBS 10117]
MASIISSIWPILTSYRPNAARDRQAQREKTPLRFGAFEAIYRPPRWGVIRPQNDKDAQRLYNHIRTIAFWLDAAPVLADLGLPFRAGLDDIISLVPIYGDLISGILQLYQVWLSFIFGVPKDILGYMILNVFLDVIVGLVPILGDFLDNLFKSNLRNLALLEQWLLTNESAQIRYHILIMPESNEFIPKPKSSRFSTSWFGRGMSSAADEERERERVTGKVLKTRRMRLDEGERGPLNDPYAAEPSPSGNPSPGASGTTTGTRRRTRQAGAGNDPVMEPVD